MVPLYPLYPPDGTELRLVRWPSAEERDRLFDDMRSLFARHRYPTGGPGITIRYTTHSYRMPKR